MQGILARSILLLCCLLVAGQLFASEDDRRRVEMAAGIFPRVVAVDEDVEDKLNGGNLVMVLVYESSLSGAEKVGQYVQQKAAKVGSFRVVTKIASVEQFLEMDYKSFTAVMIVEKLPQQSLEQVVAYSIRSGRMLMSPFEGDVEKGVMVGLFVGSRIVPWFNMHSLTRSGVRVNARLLGVSKRYE